MSGLELVASGRICRYSGHDDHRVCDVEGAEASRPAPRNTRPFLLMRN
jgi:hypothetical protein